MTHITNSQLNEYLDDELDTQQREAVEAHLATCVVCQGELAALETLFSELATLPEVAFTGDVAEAVVSQVEQEEALSGWPLWVLAIQAFVGVGLLALLWPSIQRLLQLVSETAVSATAILQPQPRLFWQDIINEIATTLEQIQMGWQLNIPFEQWAWVVALTLIIWLLGNRLLFIDPPQSIGSEIGN